MDSLKLFKLIPVFFVLLVLASCSSSDGGDASNAATTGRVSLLITDAPTDDFDQVNVTVESISFLSGDNDHETIVFDESRIVNLLALQNYSDLLVTAVIPVGTYDKIRLHVSQVELVKFVDGQDPESHITRLPANGKIDLNPRGTFEVVGNEHLIIELDLDAEKSIHIVQQGNGRDVYNFRPVVFVNIMGEEELKLVLLDGRVLARTETGFQLCDAELIEVDDSCLAVLMSENTVVQNDLIEVVPAGDVEDGDIVTVLGKANSENINALHVVIEADEEVSDLALFTGAATSDFDLDHFTMNASSDDELIQALTLTELTIALVEGSGVRVFDKNGNVVAADTIVVGTDGVGTDVDVFGLAKPDISTVTEVKAAFIIVDNEVKASKTTSGTIAAINETESQITVLANMGDTTADVCVDVSESIIFVLAIVDGKVVTKEISVNELQLDMLIDVYGEDDGSGCIAADVILVAEPFASIETNLLVTGN